MAHIAFLGTGMIGGALAEAAARRGDTVVAWNRTLSKVEALAPAGVKAAATPADAVRGATRVHVTMPDDAAVDAVLAQAGDLSHAVVVDHTTASPAGTAARAARLAAAGVAFLHAPVFMSPKLAREGQGLMLVCGPQPVRDRVRPDLEKMCARLHDLGDRPDLAAAYKLFGNAMILTITGGLADVFTMANGLGIAAPDALSLFSVFNPAATLSYRGTAMAAGDYKASFELTMARKDARLMMEVAHHAGRELTVLPAIARKMDALIERGHGADDLGVIAIDAVPAKPR